MPESPVSFGEPELAVSRVVENDSGDPRLIKSEPNTLIWSQRLPDSRQAVLKMYRRIKLFDWCRYSVGSFRVEREFRSLSYLASKGIPCTPPIYWSTGKDPAQGRFMVLATELIPDVMPLYAMLEEQGGDSVALPALYKLVRRMHEAGFYHGTLNAYNILVDTAGKDRFYLLDAPQAFVFPKSIVGTRMAWADLVTLTTDILFALDHRSLPLSRAYGLNSSGQRRLIWEHSRKMSRHERNRMRAEFGLRCALARIF
jgi:hypothetical protein